MRKRLTIGKVRGLQQMSDPSGVFAMCAMDHRDSMRRMIDAKTPDSVTAEMLVTYKRDLASTLAPVATAILLDPLYGAAQVIAGGVLPGSTGLLVSVEETGYQKEAEGRATTLLPAWGVDKVKRMGASAAKILLYYRPDLADIAVRQRALTEQVATSCAEADLAFVVEPVTYVATEEERDPAVFARRKPDLVIDSARDLTPLGIDVLKAEFPGDLRYERDEGALRAACERLDEAAQVPWILLSAGVAFDDFLRQVKMACRAGASGFLGGRAIWDEAMAIKDAQERRHWLTTVGVDRMRRLHDAAGEFGRPWWKKWALTLEDLVEVSPDWYRSYGPQDAAL